LKEVTDYSDIELIDKLLQEGDSKWFGILYDKYASKVYNKCLALTHDTYAAKDLTHDIFIKVFLSIRKFNKNSTFYTWIYSITYNACIDYLKKSNKYLLEPHTDQITEKEIVKEVEDTEIFQITMDRLKILLEKISTDDKMILLMKYQDDMTIKEIGTCFNIGESAVKMRLTRAKRKIIDMYNDKFRHSIYYLNK
jgi:RNA polymerase sigma-70 factor (ECF subfamily)